MLSAECLNSVLAMSRRFHCRSGNLVWALRGSGGRGFGNEMESTKACFLTQFAQMCIHHFSIAGLAFQFGFVVADPLDEIAALLQFAGFVQVIEISREQAITLFQLGQFRVQAMDVLDDLVKSHSLFTSRLCGPCWPS